MPAKPDFMQRQYAFAAHIRNPDSAPAPADVEDRRMAIYRELFYNNVESFLSSGFPVLRRLMNDDAWHALARDFLAQHACHSPLFMEISREFLNYIELERPEQPGDLPFMRELAHYEWVELAVSIAENEPGQPVDPDGDLLANAPVFSSVAWPLSYQYPVHRISPDFQPEIPADQPTYLLVYRNEHDDVRFIELNAVSARLFSLLQEEATLCGRQALQRIAEELQHRDPNVVIEGGARILDSWREHGIILGTAP